MFQIDFIIMLVCVDTKKVCVNTVYLYLYIYIYIYIRLLPSTIDTYMKMYYNIIDIDSGT